MATWIPDQGSADVDDVGPGGGTFMKGADNPTQPLPKITPELAAAARQASGRGGDGAARAARTANATGAATGTGRRARAGRAKSTHDLSPWQRSHAAWHRAGVDWVHADTDVRRPDPKDRRIGAAQPGAEDAAAAAEAPVASAEAAPARGETEEAARNSAGPAEVAPVEVASAEVASAEVASAEVASAEAEAPPSTLPSGDVPASESAPESAAPSAAHEPDRSGESGGLAEPSQPAPDSSAASPAGPAPAGRSSTVKGRGRLTEGPPDKLVASGARSAGAERARALRRARSVATPAPPTARAGRRRLVTAAAAGVAVLAGAGLYAVLSGDDTPRRVLPAAVRADQIFGLDPAVRAVGRDHTLDSVAGSGETVVAVGSEIGSISRGEFLVSKDGGRSWRLAHLRAADGQEPPPAEFPRLVAGGPGAWIAIGGSPAGTTLWTSTDGDTWTRQPDAVATAFGPADQVTALVRTASGFVAVGTTSPGGAQGDSRGVVWSSGDGRTWSRTLDDRLKLGEVARFERLVATGDLLLADGKVRRTTTRTVTKRVKLKVVKRKVTKTVLQPATWRSGDRGRTWVPVTIPQGQGSSGPVQGLAAGSGGFFAARDASRTTGKKKKKKTVRYGVVFGSRDGLKWTPAGRVDIGGYGSIDRLDGSASGLAALVRTGGGKPRAVLRSTDGKTWRQAGTVPSPAAGGAVTAMAALPSATVVAGRRNADDPFLSVVGVGEVDLAEIAGVVLPERTIAALASNGSQLAAVGRGNNDAAVWFSRDGRTWDRATGDLGGDGPQRLTGLVHGGLGWVAVGRTGDPPARPLVVTSADGLSWRRVGRWPGGEGTTAVSVTAGPAGYVVVGGAGSGAATWHSSDLTSWKRGTGDLGGGRTMLDVTATPTGFAAVGAHTKDKTPLPAVWTSADGVKWTSASAPPLPAGMTTGSLSHVAARGALVVATGTAAVAPASGARAGSASKTAAANQSYAFVAVSADGGRTWQSRPLLGATPGTVLTALTPTPAGFTAAGTAGPPGRSDVGLWSSQDGMTWRRSSPQGTGLDGPGAQRLTGLTTSGGELVAVGVMSDHRGDAPTLWRIPAP